MPIDARYCMTKRNPAIMGIDECCCQTSLFYLVGKEGLEPSRLAAHDPKSRLSANSSTSPIARCSLRLDYKREPHERQ